jgi:site-specific DNA-methyltransferase (adenine-specific)
MKNTETNIFENDDILNISVCESAKNLHVSTATIRNWLKAGHLVSVNRGEITKKSLIYVKNKIIGTEKLNQRANKSSKDSHNHNEIVSIFTNKIRLTSEISKLGNEYEASLSNSYRNKEGIYYTPSYIVQDLLNVNKEDISTATFCDPCCGSGNFIIRALELGFKPENIYGFDVDPVAVEITKTRIHQFCGYTSSNIQTIDFLHHVCNGNTQKYDYIYTNPPWGKKLLKEDRELFRIKFMAGSSVDSCSLFLFACLYCLNKDGNLGFLLPESFFNISSFEDARLKVLSLSVIRLVNYDKPFKGILSKSQALVIKNKPAKSGDLVKCEDAGRVFERTTKSFLSNPKSIINLHCDYESASVLEYLYKIPHTNLKKNASWGLGIVTGNNKNFIENQPKNGYIPVHKGSDITQKELKKATCYIPADLSQYQQVAQSSLYLAKEKLIYKFISSRLCFFYDKEQRYILNSANMIVLNEEFPVSNKVLGELFNSDFMNWIFSNIFNTHKILRGDLELLPIYSQFLIDKDTFNEDQYIKNLNVEKTKNGTYRIKK